MKPRLGMPSCRSALRTVAVLALAAGPAAAQLGGGPTQADPDLGTSPADAPFFAPRLLIGPVDGLTTQWHGAPAQTSFPFGTIAKFKLEPHVGIEIVDVEWEGAASTSALSAECRLTTLGTHEIRARVTDDAQKVSMHTCRLEVVDVPRSGVRLLSAAPVAAPLDLDPEAPFDQLNPQTVDIWFGPEAVSQVHQLATDYFVTSIRRAVLMDVETSPQGFEPLVEWRRIGGGAGLPADAQTFHDVGVRSFEVGPPASPLRFDVETYKVHITEPAQGQFYDVDAPVTFTAKTEPAGFEPYVSWLASTKYGSATPVLGQGPSFTVFFRDVWGTLDDGTDFQWTGVRADYAKLGQDNKPCEGLDLTIGDPVSTPAPPPLSQGETWTSTIQCASSGISKYVVTCSPVGGAPSSATFFPAGCPKDPIAASLRCDQKDGTTFTVTVFCCCGEGRTASWKWNQGTMTWDPC